MRTFSITTPGPTRTTGIAMGIVVMLMLTVVLQLRGEGVTTTQAVRYTGAFYSTNEDGSDWFVDDITKFAPFDHNGKPAYKVYVFTCDGGKTKFVGYLERFSEAGIAKLNKIKADMESGKQPGFGEIDAIYETEIEVKGPNTAWVRRIDRKSADVLNIRCPDGTQKTLEVVLPD